MPRTHPRRREAQTRRPSREGPASGAFVVREGRLQTPGVTSNSRFSGLSESARVFQPCHIPGSRTLVWSRVRSSQTRGAPLDTWNFQRFDRPSALDSVPASSPEPLAAKAARALRRARGLHRRGRASSNPRSTRRRRSRRERRGARGAERGTRRGGSRVWREKLSRGNTRRRGRWADPAVPARCRRGRGPRRPPNRLDRGVGRGRGAHRPDRDAAEDLARRPSRRARGISRTSWRAPPTRWARRWTP